MTLADGEMDEGMSTKAAGNAHEILEVKIECFAVSSEEAGDACIYRVIVLLLTGFFRGSGAIIGVEEGVKVVVHNAILRWERLRLKRTVLMDTCKKTRLLCAEVYTEFGFAEAG